MIRTFKTNQVRKTEELSGSGWTFSPHSGPHKGEHFPVTVPCCWESLPNFSAYRGTSSFETTFWGEAGYVLYLRASVIRESYMWMAIGLVLITMPTPPLL